MCLRSDVGYRMGFFFRIDGLSSTGLLAELSSALLWIQSGILE